MDALLFQETIPPPPDIWVKLTAVGTIGAAVFAAVSSYLAAVAIRRADKNTSKALRQARDEFGRQYQAQNTSVAAEWLLHLDKEWNGDDMCRQREQAAIALLLRAASVDIEHVIDFFETVGLLLRRGVLDEEMVWSTFYYWINGYYESAKDFIKASREADSSWWGDFIALCDKVREFERHHNPKSPWISLSPEQITEFLKEERDILNIPTAENWGRAESK